MPVFSAVARIRPTAATPLVAAVDPFTERVVSWVLRWQARSRLEYPGFLAPFQIWGHDPSRRIPQTPPDMTLDPEFRAWLDRVGGRIMYDPVTGLGSVQFGSHFADP